MNEKSFESLNMVPFIDIMLVLLTIVLTTSSFIASGRIPIQLPQASASPSEARPTQTIAISASGAIYYASEAVSTEQLRQRLAAVDRATPLLLRADQAVSLQHFIDVADLLQQLGFARVAVQTQAPRP